MPPDVAGIPYWLDAPGGSRGPLPGDERVDVAIVGGGVTGLSCALTLAEAGARVRVLEARRAASGASGRNGGFALRGMAAAYDRAPLPDLMRVTEEALSRLEGLAE
ncbi:MAG: FAD-binding oxidoreductase, partial [Actinomycetota bacterium]|nr:FAD-binding oxidoreductase [Actinomycetota bacterium]